MDKLKIIKWVSEYMPIEVDKKKMYLHAAGLLDPTGEFCIVCDNHPYEENTKEITATLVKVSDVTLLM